LPATAPEANSSSTIASRYLVMFVSGISRFAQDKARAEPGIYIAHKHKLASEINNKCKD
jgi:hypothetical protein